jgi:hypothetical protein
MLHYQTLIYKDNCSLKLVSVYHHFGISLQRLMDFTNVYSLTRLNYLLVIFWVIKPGPRNIYWYKGIGSIFLMYMHSACKSMTFANCS